MEVVDIIFLLGHILIGLNGLCFASSCCFNYVYPMPTISTSMTTTTPTTPTPGSVDAPLHVIIPTRPRTASSDESGDLDGGWVKTEMV